MKEGQKWILALSGASGMRYGLRLLEVLCRSNVELHLVVSDSALRVLAEEEGIKCAAHNISTGSLLGEEFDNCYIYNFKDIGAAIASGSFQVSGMVICPCSMGTIAAISSGTAYNLIQRAAEVTIKESRPLILAPRETPLSTIHLENMLKLSRLGVKVVAAMPGFYHKPQTVQDLVDLMVMKITDQMGLNIDLTARWGQSQSKRVVNV